MTSAIAKSKYLRISPRKARLAAALIRGKSVEAASYQLQFCSLKGGRLLKKTLDSAVANAESQLDLRRERMKVSTVLVDEGPRLKRAKPKNRGGRHPIQKRTSHFTVVVSEE
jgi:large subunit ribosomal protein L22